MSELTLAGLGAMGTAIAQTLVNKGCDLTVWNRSPDKTEKLAASGVSITNSLQEAIGASPRVMFCIHGYDATRQLLDDPDVRALLKGRTVIQLSTGTPAEARAAEIWVHKQGGNYLDCSIMVYPTSIGAAEGQLLVAGRRAVYDECLPYLDQLGGDVRYLGTAIGAAAALDLAVVARLVANTVAIVYGIHICESEGLPLSDFASMYPESDRARHLASVVDSGDYKENIAATVGTSIEAAASIHTLAEELGINAELPRFVLGLYERAAKAGYLEQDNASLIEVFRGNA